MKDIVKGRGDWMRVKVKNLIGEPAPLFYRYPREINPQPAYIEISKDGTVHADSSGEIGNSIPFDVWHKKTIRIGCSPFVNGDALADFLTHDLGWGKLGFLGRIHAGHSIAWDGSNHVGKLTDDAESAIGELESALNELPQATVWKADEWICNNHLSDLWPSDRSLRQAAEALEKEAEEEGIVLDGEMEEALLDRARREYRNADEDEIPFHIRTSLV